MIFRVLGCSGSELGRNHPCSFQIGENILVDMGSAASRLALTEQSKITDIFLSHAHLDHTKDIAFFAENIFQTGSRPVKLRGTQNTLDKIRRNILNDEIWPNFAVLPQKVKPMLEYEPFEIQKEFSCGSLKVLAIDVNHPGGCEALFFQSSTGSILYTGDTGPTDKVWEEVNRRKSDMKAILLETSFPNRLSEVAQASGHHTPESFSHEIRKIHLDSVPIFVYHLKAPYQDETVKELKELIDHRVRFLEPGMRIDF